MKKNNLIALTALTAIAAGATVYFIRKAQRDRRKKIVSNAGYEMAYDVHYPIKYSRKATL